MNPPVISLLLLLPSIWMLLWYKAVQLLVGMELQKKKNRSRFKKSTDERGILTQGQKQFDQISKVSTLHAKHCRVKLFKYKERNCYNSHPYNI